MFGAGVKHLFVKHLFGRGVDTEQVFGQTSEHPFGTVHSINRTGQMIRTPEQLGNPQKQRTNPWHTPSIPS